MSQRTKPFAKFLEFAALAALAAVTATLAPPQAAAGEEMRRIIEETELSGGLVVVLGCPDDTDLASLRPGDGFVVQALDADPAKVATARKALQDKGVYAPVSVNLLEGAELPYIDDLVNLLMVSDDLGVGEEEMKRVLVPGGVLVSLSSSGGRSGNTGHWVKPRPAGLDDWTHYRHGADGNTVSEDTVLKPPLGRLQWTAGPKNSRHHERMSSASAMISDGARLYEIVDTGERVSIFLPPHWKLVCRDAFNGLKLWERDIGQWADHMTGFKSGPQEVTRLLVAGDGMVFVPLDIRGQVLALDAVTGETLHAFDSPRDVKQLVYADGKLIAANNDRVGCFSAGDGTTLWSRNYDQIVINTLASLGGRVYFHDGKGVRAVSLGEGAELWQSAPLALLPGRWDGFAPTLVATDKVVLFSGGEKPIKKNKIVKGINGVIVALNAATGEEMWRREHPPSGYTSPEDAFVIGDRVWFGDTTDHGNNRKSGGGKSTGTLSGYNLFTGELEKTIESPQDVFWFHHRCYPAKATENFILLSRTGTEFVDLDSGLWSLHHWVRGACIYGLMPANGMIYYPMNPCACYPMAKLAGLTVVGPQRPVAESGLPRLVRGEAPMPGVRAAPTENPTPETTSGDWPIYRHDPARSAYTPAEVAASFEPAWEAALPGKPTPPTMAGGKLFVAIPDKNAVRALDAETGETLWTYTAGGPVDSPPTIAGVGAEGSPETGTPDTEGALLCVFGSADGHIHCLDAGTGRLVWRFRAAPNTRRHVHYDKLESTHPVSGSVLVMDGKVYAIAGRYRFLDGGLRMVKLDLATGVLENETVLGAVDRHSGEEIQRMHPLEGGASMDMPASRADILVGDNGKIYMLNQAFDLDGNDLPPVTPDNEKHAMRDEDRHLIAANGLLDHSFWHRTYQVYGSDVFGGFGPWATAGTIAPAGYLLVFDDENAYGYGREPTLYRNVTELSSAYYAAKKDGGRFRWMTKSSAASFQTST